MADQIPMAAWAKRFSAGGDLEFDSRELSKGRDITAADLLEAPDVPPAQKQWIRQYLVNGVEWADANNPPNFVDDEALWNKAKRAASSAGADDTYAFANWWYHEHE